MESSNRSSSNSKPAIRSPVTVQKLVFCSYNGIRARKTSIWAENPSSSFKEREISFQALDYWRIKQGSSIWSEDLASEVGNGRELRGFCWLEDESWDLWEEFWISMSFRLKSQLLLLAPFLLFFCFPLFAFFLLSLFFTRNQSMETPLFFFCVLL